MSGLQVDFTAERSDLDVQVAFAVAPGQVSAIIGPNGAGKSTVVDVIAGLLRVDRGHVRLAGQTLDDPAAGVFVPARSRRVGVVFQDRVLFPHLTALENVAFGMTARGVAKDVARARAAEQLRAAGLGDLADRSAGELSGGEAQRVAIARALAMEPEALLLDEPFSAVDAAARADIRHQLRVHVDAFPGPVVLVTHDPAEAFMLAGEVHVLEAGVLTQTGRPDDIRLRPATAYAAEFARVNLLQGVAADGVVDVGGHELRVADTSVRGQVVVTIQPSAIAVYRRRPEGSPRNAWDTTIDAVELLGDRVRLHVGAPLPLTVEVTPGAVDALDLAAGAAVWLSVKATEIGLRMD